MTSTHAAAWLALAERLADYASVQRCFGDFDGACIEHTDNPADWCGLCAAGRAAATLRAMAAQQERPQAECPKCGQQVATMIVLKYHRNNDLWCPGAGTNLDAAAPAETPQEQAAKPADGQQDWQPIETAPREPRAIIGRTWDGHVHPVWWNRAYPRWEWCSDGYHSGQAPRLTHWLPLPATTQATPHKREGK